MACTSFMCGGRNRWSWAQPIAGVARERRRAPLKKRCIGLFLAIVVGGGHLSASALLAAEKANAMFIELCSICHGTGGKGDGPSAAGLNPKPADFSNCQVMASLSEETLFNIIKRGGQSAGRSTVMPAWGEALSDEQIRDLLAV